MGKSSDCTDTGDFRFKFSIAYHEHIPDIFLSIRIKILSDEVCLCLTFGCGEFHVYIPIPERGRQGAEIVIAHDISVHKMLVIQRSSVFSPAEAQFARFQKNRYFLLTALDLFSRYIYSEFVIGKDDSNPSTFRT